MLASPTATQRFEGLTRRQLRTPFVRDGLDSVKRSGQLAVDRACRICIVTKVDRE